MLGGRRDSLTFLALGGGARMRRFRLALAAGALFFVGICYGVTAGGGGSPSMGGATLRLKGGFKRTMMVAMNSKEVPKLDPGMFRGDPEDEFDDFVDQVCAEPQELLDEVDADLEEQGLKDIEITDEEVNQWFVEGTIKVRRPMFKNTKPGVMELNEEPAAEKEPAFGTMQDFEPNELVDDLYDEEDEGFALESGAPAYDGGVSASISAQLANLGFTESPADVARAGGPSSPSSASATAPAAAKARSAGFG